MAVTSIIWAMALSLVSVLWATASQRARRARAEVAFLLMKMSEAADNTTDPRTWGQLNKAQDDVFHPERWFSHDRS